MTNLSCIRCFVSGKVQGVWYRASAQDEANKLGITGWAKNLDDGRVEVFACGAAENLKKFYEWLQDGPQLALVEECTYEKLLWEEYVDFNIY